MSRLNQQNTLNYGNKETHIFTEFGTLAKESTQKEVLEAIQNINIQVEGGTFEASDTITHNKLDTLNTTITNKHLSSATDSVSASITNTSIAVTGDFYPATQPISGSISVSNFPSSQPISGSVSVSNFPATQPISGSVSANITNASIPVTGDFYPATQPISGSVSANITNSSIPVTGTFFQTTQPISGSVSVSNFPATQPISGSVSANITNASIPVTGDFYPATQPISGSVSANITNSSIPVTGTFFQTTQPISGSVSVSNFPSSQPVSGSVSVSNFPTTQPISGSVSANITNASIPVTGDFYPATQPISGSVSANITNSSIPVTGTFFQTTQPISGSVSVSNFPATQPISGSVSANITNSSIPVTGTFFQTTQPISGSVSVTSLPAINATTNSISIYGNDGATNHIIKTNGAGEILIGNTTITVEGTVTIDALPEIDASTNSMTIYGTNESTVNAIRTNANGELKTEITNNITGYALETTQNSILTNTNKIKSDGTIPDAIQVAVKNTVPVSGSVGITGTPTVTVGNTNIDTRCYASNNGTTWHHLKSDATGQLNIHAMAQDGAGNDITSTVISAQRALDVNIAGGTLSVSSVNIKDSSGNNINALTGPSNCAGAVKTALYGLQTDSAIGDTQTTYGSINKIGLNSFICNGSSEPVICGGYDGTNNRVIKTTTTGVVYTALDTANNIVKLSQTSTDNTVKLDTANNTIKLSQTSTDNTVKIDTSNNGIKLPLNTGTATSAVVDLLIPSIALNQPGLLVGALSYGRNIYTTSQDLVTVSTQAQVSNVWTGYDTYIRNGMTSNTITSGLNVYPINPIKLSYTIGGYNSNTTGNSNQCLGFNGTFDSQALTTTFGLGNPKYYWIYIATALDSGIIDFDYVNSSGVIVTGATRTVASANTWTSLFSTNVTIGGLLKYQKRGGSGAGNQVEIAWTNTNVAPTSRATNIGTHGNNSYFLGLMTVPLGYTGIIKSISTYANTSTIFNIIKYENTNNNRLTVWGTTNSTAVPVIYNPNIEIEEGCSVLVSKQGLASDVYYYAQIDLVKKV